MPSESDTAVDYDRRERIASTGSEPQSDLPKAATYSLLHYAPALILLAIVVADLGRYADTDAWGHVYFGEMVLHQHHLAVTDPYSYSAAGHQWLIHEWLSEIIMGGVYSLFGNLGLKLLKFACSAATIVMLAVAEGETGAPPAIQFGVLIVTAFALAPQMQFRPQIFTFALLAALIAGLARDNYGRRAPLWLAVPGLALWANLHGGFFIGIVILAAYSGIAALQDLIGGRGMRRGIYLIGLTIAGALATLLTPYGRDGWYTVAHSLTNPMTREVMADWRPLSVILADMLRGSHAGLEFVICVLAILAATALCFLLTPRGGDLPLVAIAMLMTLAAFMSVRNMALAVITASVPLARHLGLMVRRTYDLTTGNIAAPTSLSRATQWIIGALAITLAIVSGLFSYSIPAAGSYPDGAVAFMEAHDLHGNILNYFSWGQYLIWHMAPRSKVFIDGRFDLVYPPRIVTDYLDFYNAKDDAARVLTTYPHDFVLLPPDSPACGFMLTSSDWKPIYRDGNAVLFVKRDTRAAHIPPVVIKGSAGRSYFP